MDSDAVEIERFINLRVCMQCYSYEHITKNCEKSSDYLICSECSIVGHRYINCRYTNKKYINCAEPHKTLALRCKVRKDKIKEIETKKKTKMQASKEKEASDKVMTKISSAFDKLPDNFIPAIAGALLMAKMKEAEESGSFQRVLNEILKKNNIPKFIIPRTVIDLMPDTGQSHPQDQDKMTEVNRDKRKRDSHEGQDDEDILRTSTGTETAVDYELVDGVFVPVNIGPTGLKLHPSLTPTPVTSPAETPAFSPPQESGATAKTKTSKSRRSGTSKHIRERLGMASAITTKLRRFSVLKKYTQMHLYRTYVRPIAEYPIIPTCTASNTAVAKFQKMQNKTIRRIIKDPDTTLERIEELHEEFKLETINTRLHRRANRAWDRTSIKDPDLIERAREARDDHTSREHRWWPLASRKIEGPAPENRA